MISVQLGVSLAEALARLRAHAFAASAAVGDVAGDVANRRLRFETGGGADGGTGCPPDWLSPAAHDRSSASRAQMPAGVRSPPAHGCRVRPWG